MLDNVLWYQNLGMGDVDRVGGKNASLGEMISNLSSVGVQVPNGFATTSYAFNELIRRRKATCSRAATMDPVAVTVL